MGYRLYREVMAHVTDGVTHREKLVALVIADVTPDETRVTTGSVYDPEILRRAMVKNDRDMRKIIAKLRQLGILEQVSSGHNGAVAVFRFLPLAPIVDESVDISADSVDNTVDKSVETGQEGGSIQTSLASELEEKEVQIEPPTTGVGGSIWHSSRFDLNRPISHRSKKKISSSSPRGLREDDEEIPARKTRRIVEFTTEIAARHIVGRGIGITLDQARAIVALLGREAAERGRPVGAWHRYIERFSDDQLIDAFHRVTQQPKDRPETPPKCGECGPQRMVELPAGRLARCPRCHPLAVRNAATVH